MSFPNVGGYERAPYEIAIQAHLQHLAGAYPAIYQDQAAPEYDGLHLTFTVTSNVALGYDEHRTHATEDEDEAPTATAIQHTTTRGVVTVQVVGDGARALADGIFQRVENPVSVEHADALGLSIHRASSPQRIDALQGQGYLPSVVFELGFLWASRYAYDPGFIATIYATDTTE